MTTNIFPWQINQWHQLIKCNQDNSLPHALLFVGDQGIGKHQFALSFAQALLCQSHTPCEQCHSCYLIRAHSHPDLLIIEPKKSGQLIKIDQIREAIAFSNETSFQGGLRIIIITPANAMNVNAANALLKTLEEPAPNTLLILVSETNLRLPATIISRCCRVVFPKPNHTLALDWLQSKNINTNSKLLLSLANGAPLKAKEFSEEGIISLREEFYQKLNLLIQQKTDPLQLAAELHEKDIVVLLNLLLIWLQDLLRCKLTNGKAKLINFDYELVISQLVQTIDHKKILDYLDHVKKCFAHIINHINLNKQLLLEELFIRWTLYATR